MAGHQLLLSKSAVLERGPELRRKVHKTLLQFSDVISIRGYGKTNLVSHSIVLEPGGTPIKMRHRPIKPVMEGALKK